jgi:hypothetical protein
MIRFETKDNENALIVDKINNRLGIKTTTPRTVLDINTNDKIIIPKGTTSERTLTTTNNTEIHGAMRFNTDLDSFEVYSKEPNGSTGAGNYNWRSFSRLISYGGDSEIFLGNRYVGIYDQDTVPDTQNTNITFKTNNINRMTIHRDGIVEVDNNSSSNYPVFVTDYDVSHIWVNWNNTSTGFDFYQDDGTGTASLNIGYSSFNIHLTKTYVFHRKDTSDTHPFYIIDQKNLDTGTTTFINHEGDGDYNTGITGTQTFTLTFNSLYDDITTGYSNILYYYYTPVSNNIGGTFSVQNDNMIHIWVDGGSMSFPYYYFYEGTNTTPDLDKQYFNLTLDIQKVYRFHRINSVTSHPFYISDQGRNQTSTSKITVSGYGSYNSGIMYQQYFDLKFNQNDDITSHKSFNLTSHNLYYYCTYHSSMVNTFHLMNSRPYLKTSSTVNTTNSNITVNSATINNTLTAGPSILLSTGTLSSTATTSSFLTIKNNLTLQNNANLCIKEHAKFKSTSATTSIGTTHSSHCFNIVGDTYVGGSTYQADCLDISGLGSSGIYIPTSVSNPTIGHLRLNSSNAFYGHNNPIKTSTSASINLSTLYNTNSNTNSFLEYYNGDVWQNVDQGRTRGNLNSYNRPPYMIFSATGMDLFTSSSLTRLGHYTTTLKNYKISTDHPYLFGYADGTNGGILVNQPGVYMATFVARTSAATIIGFSLLKDTTTDSDKNLDSTSNESSSNVEYLYKDDRLTWSGTYEPTNYGYINLAKETIFKKTFMFTLDAPSALILKVRTSVSSALSKIQLRITAMSFWDPSEITETTIA